MPSRCSSRLQGYTWGGKNMGVVELRQGHCRTSPNRPGTVLERRHLRLKLTSEGCEPRAAAASELFSCWGTSLGTCFFSNPALTAAAAPTFPKEKNQKTHFLRLFAFQEPPGPSLHCGAWSADQTAGAKPRQRGWCSQDLNSTLALSA